MFFWFVLCFVLHGFVLCWFGLVSFCLVLVWFDFVLRGFVNCVGLVWCAVLSCWFGLVQCGFGLVGFVFCWLGLIRHFFFVWFGLALLFSVDLVCFNLTEI